MKRTIPLALKVNGVLSHDREEWLLEALRFALERFGEPNNDEHAQEMRLDGVACHMKARRLDGIFAPQVSLSDVLQGRAAMKKLTRTGNDGCPPEVYQALPFLTVIQLLKVL